jgi:hypothetical protein
MTSYSEAPTADQNPYPIQAGTWTLIAPDGRRWRADTPIKCVSAEQKERIPAAFRLARIMHEADTWVEGIIELKRDGDYLIVSVERKGKYVEVIRTYEPDNGPLCHAVHPSGIDEKLKEAGLL